VGINVHFYPGFKIIRELSIRPDLDEISDTLSIPFNFMFLIYEIFNLSLNQGI
jgi:hypothetical protein